MSGVAKVSGPPVALSTSSVYPERTPDAFEVAARLGYDGVEVMVYTDPVSQAAEALLRLQDYHQLPIVSVHAPSLLLTQRVWGREPWEKLRRAQELAERVGARVVVLHPPFRWQREYVRGFETGLAAMAEETDVLFAVENMYPLRAGGSEVVPYAPHWDPTALDVPSITLDLSHTAASGSDALIMATELGSRLAHVHLADGTGSPAGPVPDEHLVPGRGGQPCGELLSLLPPAGYPGAVVVEVKTNRAPTREDRMADLAESLAFARQHLAVAAGSRQLNVVSITMAATLITVAPTGAEADKAAAPALPVTLAELVVTAKECEAAGAAVIHVHIRDDAARPTLEVGRLADTVAALREGTGLIVQLSTGGAVTDSFASRLAVLDAAPDACSLTCGTVNFGDDVFSNPWPFIKDLYQLTKERQVVPEFELFDLGHIATLGRLLAEFGPPAGGHVHCDLVMGVPGGMPGDVATLAAAVAALPDGATWSATGIGRTTLPVMLGALGAGGHLRVGMEDTLTFSRGRPVARNAELVERAADLARLAQRPPMPPAEARTFLSIPTRPT